MYKSKKLFSVIMCVAVLLACLAPTFTVSAGDFGTLQFNEDGKFKILQLADIQTYNPQMRADARLLKDFIEAEEVDLIVLTGDQHWGDSTDPDTQHEESIRSFMDILDDADTPVAAVFGNHDADDNNITENKKYQMEIYSSYPCFIGGVGEIFGTRVGNYNLPILSSDGERYAFNLYFFDSGISNDENDLDGYGCVHKDQIEWYKGVSEELKNANNGEPLPSISFQHIIVPEVFDVLVEDDSEIGWSLPEGNDGYMGELPCPPHYSNGQFDAFLEQGDVIAAVSGHDHVNSFVVNNQGIDIINTAICSFSSYTDESMGYRVIVLDENDPENYETYTKSYFEFYGDDTRAKLRFDAYSTSSPIIKRIFSWIAYDWDYALLAAAALALLIAIIVLTVKKIRKKIKAKKQV